MDEEEWESTYGISPLQYGISMQQGVRETMEDAAQVVPHGRYGFFFASEPGLLHCWWCGAVSSGGCVSLSVVLCSCCSHKARCQSAAGRPQPANRPPLCSCV